MHVLFPSQLAKGKPLVLMQVQKMRTAAAGPPAAAAVRSCIATTLALLGYLTEARAEPQMAKCRLSLFPLV